ncbi:MAG: hypothetical protein Q8O67_06200 [Deltaproteobacteria bacterium]|nr:hypothetical protein [Deltaproteobacteria bacterium]
MALVWQEHWDDAALWRGDAAGVGAWTLLGALLVDVDEPEPQVVASVDVDEPEPQILQALIAANDDDDFATGEVTAPTRPGLGADNVVVALAHLPAHKNPRQRAALLGLVVLAGLALWMGLEAKDEEAAVVVVPVVPAPIVVVPVAVIEEPKMPEEPHCVRPPTTSSATRPHPPAPRSRGTGEGGGTAKLATPPPSPVPLERGAGGVRSIAILDVSGDDRAGAQRVFARSARAALQKAGYGVDGDARFGLKLRVTRVTVSEGAESSADVSCDAVVVKLPERFLRGSTRGSAAAAGEVPSDELVDDAVTACAQQVIAGAVAQIRRGAAD